MVLNDAIEHGTLRRLQSRMILCNTSEAKQLLRRREVIVHIDFLSITYSLLLADRRHIQQHILQLTQNCQKSRYARAPLRFYHPL